MLYDINLVDNTKVLDKWVKAKAVEIAFAPENPLGQWRNMIQDLYDIKLELPAQK